MCGIIICLLFLKYCTKVLKKDLSTTEKRKLTGKVLKWILLLGILSVLIYYISAGYGAIKTVYRRAKDAKETAEEAVELLLEKDLDGARGKIFETRMNIKYFRGILKNETVYKIGCSLPKYGKDFRYVCFAIDMIDKALDDWADRAFKLVKGYPLDNVIREEGFDVRTLMEYLTFAEEVVPEAESFLETFSTIELSDIHLRGFVDSIFGKLDKYLDVYHKAEYYFPLIHAALGDCEDKLFLIVAQNTAEIRPCGGFPGSMGTVRVKDGILSIGDFESVWDIYKSDTPYYLMPPSYITQLFGGFFIWPRDAEFCPDFEYLAPFWSTMYNYEYGRHLDGIISMTPAIVQDVVGILGDIEMSSGDVLTGSNTVRLLQYDWYVRYMNRSAISSNIYAQDDKVNYLFSETVDKVKERAEETLEIEMIPKILDVIEKAADDRIFMMWLNDSEGEALVKNYGFSGGLNKDPEAPAIGVFYGNDYGEKLGWWIDADVYVSDGRLLSSGRMEYDVSVVFRNNFRYADRYAMGPYIIGKPQSAVLSWYAYVFAPAGGTVSSMYIDYWQPCSYSSFQGLQVGYKNKYYINPESTSTIRCKITTAPGVTVKPTVYQTPTLTKYR